MVKIESDGVLQKVIDIVMSKKKAVLQSKMTPEGINWKDMILTIKYRFYRRNVFHEGWSYL